MITSVERCICLDWRCYGSGGIKLTGCRLFDFLSPNLHFETLQSLSVDVAGGTCQSFANEGGGKLNFLLAIGCGRLKLVAVGAGGQQGQCGQ